MCLHAYRPSLWLIGGVKLPLTNLTSETTIESLFGILLIILPVADDPIDFIIELGNECDDLQYIAEKTNELFNTTYTEDDIQRIINEFSEAITE